MKKPFVHLHTHSEYSLLDGLSRVQDLINAAKEYEMPALALTDHGNMYGAIDFYKSCKAQGVKPIIGVEAYIANRTRFDKEPNIDNKRYHLILLAKNHIGYKNLMRMVSLSHIEGHYYKPRMDKELLRAHSEGIICLSGCFGSELSRALRNRDDEHAKMIIAEHQDIFGAENYFLEIQKHPGIEGHAEVENALIRLGKELGVPVVATQDSHYTHADDKKAHETLLAVAAGNADGDSKFTFGVDDFSFIPTGQAYDYFSHIPEAVENTNRVAEMCEIELELGKWYFPDMGLPAETNPDDEMKRLAHEGLARRRLEETPQIMERLEYELKVICDKGYSPYFLVVGDLLRFARENGILTNVRGSVAGSLVTYALNITNVNPFTYNLPFERFLNPERPSAPDIDMDFADNRRDEVIEYAKKKYGENRVAQIGTFGTMMAKGAVRDVARALGHPYAVGDRISNMIPIGSQGFPMTIDHAMELEPDLKKAYDTEKETREIIDIAKKLEGCVRHISVHAAGVVISPTDLIEWVPVQNDPKGGKRITQYDMYVMEDVGLLKFDFLGIKNLAILADAIRLVERYRNEKLGVDTLPLDDKKTFDMLSRGETIGVFQLNGSGMTRYLKDLQPSTVHDINLMVALYRPGPMDNINEYIARKNGKKPTTYPHPKMKSFLERTYGVLVYQDDLLMTAIEVAGYSWGEVDKFRKAVGKKIPSEMKKQHKIFVEGCVTHSGMTKDKAEDLWKLFEPFQGYGFNKAHAASYGVMAYQTAYMKANYPTEYMTAILTAEAGDVEKISEIITECARMKIAVLPPDVNESFGDFAIVLRVERPTSQREQASSSEQIRFGLFSVKNLGTDIAQAIIDERERSGKFASFADFLARIQHKNLNKKSLEALIKCGALDSLGDRADMLASIEGALEYRRSAAKTSQKQTSLFGGSASAPSDFRLQKSSGIGMKEKLAWEKELLGLYVSGHPLNEHKERLDMLGMTIARVKNLRDGVTVAFGGIVEEIKMTRTKNGEAMAFLKIADFNDSIEAVVFPRTLRESKDFLLPQKTLFMKATTSHRNGGRSVIVEKVSELY